MFAAVASAQSPGTALTVHAPTLNGRVEGSIQQMSAEGATLNGSAFVTGDLSLPGTPTVRLNGKPAYAGTIDGTGNSSPSGYQVTLNGGASLGHVIRRTDPVPLTAVAAPPQPAGTQGVSINKAGQNVGDWSRLRNLTLNGNAGQVAVPAGTYGDFTASGGSGFTLGVAGASQPSIYNFQHLTLNGNAVIKVVGPVMITLANGFACNGSMGSSAHPEWLALSVAANDLTLNGGASLYGYVNAPGSAVTVNGSAQLVGGVSCGRLAVNGNGVIRLLNLPPAISLASPQAASVTRPPAVVELQADATDADGWIQKVEFFSGTTKIGEADGAPFQFDWSGVPSGTYSLTAIATDNAGGVATSAPVSVVVDAPPVVSLSAPASGATVIASSSLTLAATATDSDGSVAKVDFYADAALLGTATSGRGTTFSFQLQSGLNRGDYTLAAVATDDLGQAAASAPVAIHVIQPQPPALAFASLSSGAILAASANVKLSVTASDPNGGSISKVAFYLGKTLLGEVTTPDAGTTSSFSFVPPSGLPIGTDILTARAYSSYGLSTDTTLSVTVLPSLPYGTDFESGEGYLVGDLSGQLGWTVNQGAAQVTAQDASHGHQSVILQPSNPPAQIEQVFAPQSEGGVVFVDFFAKPVAEPSVTAGTSFEVESSLFAFSLNGTNGTLQAFGGDGSGGGKWVPTSFSTAVGSGNQASSWTRLTARLDFARKTWDLYANGAMVAADLGFRDNTRTSLSSFFVQGDVTTATLVDYVFAGPLNPLFADVNNDGIDDAWEAAHGLSLATNDRSLSPSGSGIQVLQAYLGGTDPNDYYNGVKPAVVAMDSATTGNERCLGMHVTHADGTPWVGAPVTFTVRSGNRQIAPSDSSTSYSSVVKATTDSKGNAYAWLEPLASN